MNLHSLKAFFTRKWPKRIAFGVGVAAPVLFLTADTALAHQIHLTPPVYPWSHRGVLSSLDHASIRRGFEVYRQVCAACHSTKLLRFRHFVGVSHTEEELKEIAAEYEIDDEPDDDGNVVKRPRNLQDAFPEPYDNENQAKAMNGGAKPPDLSKIVMSREHYEDYIFSMLIGYEDPPEDMPLKDGQYFNVYFPGNVLGMGPPLYDGQMEFTDGTPATASQMAKDVTIFLKYCAVPYFDAAETLYVKGTIACFIAFVGLYWGYRRIFNITRTAKVVYKKFNWKR